MTIKAAETESDLTKCRNVILELRPHLKELDLWQQYQIQQKENFRILYIESGGEAVAFAGYRIMNMFYSGRTLYIDDLCTLTNYRGKGYAKLLLERIKEEAGLNNCGNISLDSGHHRYPAHRLYLNNGFTITAHHFEMK